MVLSGSWWLMVVLNFSWWFLAVLCGSWCFLIFFFLRSLLFLGILDESFSYCQFFWFLVVIIVS